MRGVRISLVALMFVTVLMVCPSTKALAGNGSFSITIVIGGGRSGVYPGYGYHQSRYGYSPRMGYRGSGYPSGFSRPYYFEDYSRFDYPLGPPRIRHSGPLKYPLGPPRMYGSRGSRGLSPPRMYGSRGYGSRGSRGPSYPLGPPRIRHSGPLKYPLGSPRRR